jgi:lipocalin
MNSLRQTAGGITIMAFETFTENCKYQELGNIDGAWLETCRHPANIPKGCSWGNCIITKCPIWKVG